MEYIDSSANLTFLRKKVQICRSLSSSSTLTCEIPKSICRWDRPILTTLLIIIILLDIIITTVDRIPQVQQANIIVTCELHCYCWQTGLGIQACPPFAASLSAGIWVKGKDFNCNDVAMIMMPMMMVKLIMKHRSSLFALGHWSHHQVAIDQEGGWGID